VIAAILGCLGALGLGAVVVVVVAGALFFTRASAPVATAVPVPVPAPIETAPPPPVDSDGGEEDEDFTLAVQHTPYTIRGSTEGELRQQMNQLGPVDAYGRHDAYTRWYVRWTHPYDRSASSCSLGDVKVSVQITYTLPDWKPPADASPAVVARWNRYMSALQKHENGHRDHGVAAGRAVLAALRRVGEHPTCDAAGTAASTEGNRILDEYRKKDRSYDTTTRHGATQGATFP
jgi:predicted secreted Zn-dependent protease